MSEILLISEMENPVINKIRARWHEIDSMAGVGLDPDITRIPQEVWQYVGEGKDGDAITYFNQRIIDATSKYVVDFKVNSNFYQGEHGRKALAETFGYIRKKYPNVVRVYDGKFADVGHTAEHMAEEIFGNIDADAVLLNPYLGKDGIEPFTRWKNKLVILCVNTSNPSADVIQNLRLANGLPLWMHILQTSLQEWNENGNIIPVLSATHPENLKDIRQTVGQLPILLAGIGTQGGSLESSLPFCLDNEGYGVMISDSRAVLYPKLQFEGERFEIASKRAVIDLKTRINTAKQQIFPA